MPADKRDIQGLVYFANRLRNETHGCNKWDEAGTFKVFAEELMGTHLTTALERVIGHATDPEAKTPGAIKRPFVPEPTSAPQRVPYDAAKVCHVCSLAEDECRRRDGGHAFESVARRRARAAGDPTAAKEAIAPTRTWATSETTKEDA